MHAAARRIEAIVAITSRRLSIPAEAYLRGPLYATGPTGQSVSIGSEGSFAHSPIDPSYRASFS